MTSQVFRKLQISYPISSKNSDMGLDTPGNNNEREADQNAEYISQIISVKFLLLVF